MPGSWDRSMNAMQSSNQVCCFCSAVKVITDEGQWLSGHSSALLQVEGVNEQIVWNSFLSCLKLGNRLVSMQCCPHFFIPSYIWVVAISFTCRFLSGNLWTLIGMRRNILLIVKRENRLHPQKNEQEWMVLVLTYWFYFIYFNFIMV